MTMDPRFRVGVVGAGYFSQFHCMGWRNIDGVEVVALADQDQLKARGMAERYGIPRIFADLEPMLDEMKLDLVDLVTPPETHRPLIRSAIERRMPVICQKHFCTTFSEAVEVTELAEAAGVPLVVHENFRWQPWYRETRRLIDAGRLGVLHDVAFRLRPGDGQGPDAYLDRQRYFRRMPRFLVYETAIHWIDTFRFLMGDVTSVYAHLRRMNPCIAGEDAGYIVFEFANRATGMLDANRLNDHVAANPRRTMGEMWIAGAAGVLRLDGDARLWWKPHGKDEDEHRYDPGPSDAFGGGACESLQRHVLQHLDHGTRLENGARDYLANLRIEEAVYQSDLARSRVDLGGAEARTASGS